MIYYDHTNSRMSNKYQLLKVNEMDDEEEPLGNMNDLGDEIMLGTDNSTMSKFLQTGRTFAGGLVAALCLPFCCCGCGTMKVVEEGYCAAVLKFGKLDRIVGPGTYYYNVGRDEFIIVSTQIQTLNIPSQKVITSDSVSITLDAVCFFRVVDVKKALFQVQKYTFAVQNVSQSTLETLLGEVELNDLLTKRQQVAGRISEILDRHTSKWGIHIEGLEIKDIRIPESMKRVFAAKAEAEREGQAELTAAKYESDAASIYAEASEKLTSTQGAMQLRYLKTLTDIAAEKNSTIIVPSEIIKMFGH